jgi:hypothetical protein
MPENYPELHTYPPMKMEQSVPKRRHIKFRCRGITQKKHTTFGTRRKFEVKNTTVERQPGLFNEFAIFVGPAGP